jgi:hypothetical protein
MVQAFLLSEGKDTKSLRKQKNILCFFSKKDSKERFLPTFVETPPYLPFSSGMPINTGVTEGEELLKHLPDTSPNTSPQHPPLCDSDIRYQFYNERYIIKRMDTEYRIQFSQQQLITYNL